MRIIIDTEMQAIIVPDSYHAQVDKLNEIIVECGGAPLDYTKYIQTCFDKAYAARIIRQSDVMVLKGEKARRNRKKKTE